METEVVRDYRFEIPKLPENANSVSQDVSVLQVQVFVLELFVIALSQQLINQSDDWFSDYKNLENSVQAMIKENSYRDQPAVYHDFRRRVVSDVLASILADLGSPDEVRSNSEN